MKYLFAFSLSVLLLVAFGQNENQNDIVKVFNEELLQDAPYSTWYNAEYAYTPNTEVITQLSTLNLNYDIVIVLGTWCSDTQKQVPRFLKILDLIDYDKNKMTLIGVDQNKSLPNYPISNFNIEKVPTFIIYKNKVEVGRITESPSATLEQDLLNILQD